MITRFGNGFYKLENPSDITDVIEDLEERESIPVSYKGDQTYPFYCLCNNEYIGCDYLIVHILPKELVSHLKGT